MNSVFCALKYWWLSLKWFKHFFCLNNGIYWTMVEGKIGPKIATLESPKKERGNFNFGGIESP